MIPIPKAAFAKTKRRKKPNDEELFAALAREDYAFWLEYSHRGAYKHARHTLELARLAQEVEAGRIMRLIITVPPRHSKSMSITESLPAWFMGRDPKRKVIAIGYGDKLAQRFGRLNREKIRDFGPSVFGVQLSRDVAKNVYWGFEKQPGLMVSAGIGGPILGEGADLIIIDDPTKNRMEALSQTYREMVWTEWQSTISSRLSATGRVIVIMTRWHEDDLVGRLLREEPGIWTVLNLPAEAEANDPLGRMPGEMLWPENGFDETWAIPYKQRLYVWAGLYQGRPTPITGGIIKRAWLHYYEEEPRDRAILADELAQSWDCAFGKTADSSFVVGEVWARKGADKSLIDQVRARMDFPETIRAFLELSMKWPQAKAKYIEEKANGAAVIQTLRSKVSGIIAVNPTESKEARLYAVSDQFESGNIWIPKPSAKRPWVVDWVEEIVAAPNGINMDQADAASQAISQMSLRWTRASDLLGVRVVGQNKENGRVSGEGEKAG